MALTNEIDEISQHLEAAGLTVAAPWGSYLGWVDIIVFFDRHPDPQWNIAVYTGRCMIARAQNQWRFLVWDSIPGPGPETLDYLVDTPDEIVKITLQFCLGAPLIIAGWRVPTQRHPEWDGQRLRLAIAHAETLTDSAWEQIKHDTREHYRHLLHERRHMTSQPRTSAWDEWYSRLWVWIEHEDPARKETLWLRRDLQATYVVAGEKKIF